MSSMTVCPRFSQLNIAAPGANTNIIATSITPKMSGRLRVTVVLATASVFNAIEISGGSTYTHGLNQSVQLNAGDEYIFDVGMTESFTYNFQVETNGIITKLQVDEVYV